MTLRSITLRLSLLFALIASSILVSVGWYLDHALVEHFQQRDRAELAGKVELVRHLLSELKQEGDIANDAHRFRDAMVGHGTLHLWLIGKEGGTIFGTTEYALPSGIALTPAPADARLTAVSDWFPGADQHFRIMTAWGTVGARSDQQVRIVLLADASDHLGVLSRFRSAMVSAIAAALLASVVLGAWVTRRELRPVTAIAEAASAISASRLGNRLDGSSVPDEVRPLVQAFNAMLARLDQSFTRLSQFSSDVAHEFRTPIANLVMQTQVTVSRARSAEEYRHALESNLEEFDRLSRMISDMLFLAMAEHHDNVLRFERLELNQVAAAVAEFFDPVAQERQVSVLVSGRAEATADRLLVQRAIANLLSNAIRYTASGATVQIVIDAAVQDGVLIRVSNPGPDILSEHLPRLFDRFYRVDPAREKSAESCGLGLAIAKSIMTLHNGTITVRSMNNLTTFTLFFPDQEQTRVPVESGEATKK